ncbi:MAG: iron ABC transporter permease [Anaerolineae bacterium]|nr:iron ABC transporter permease [Anaerolineae bacterium]
MDLLKSGQPFALSLPAHRTPLLLAGLILLLGLVLLAAVGLGAVQIGPGQVVAILARQIGLNLPITYESQQAMVLLAIRLPRVVLGLLIGAALAVSGAAVQGLFRNPLADPTLIGIASGAALAAVAVIVLGATLFEGLTAWLGLYTLPIAAFVGGLVTTLLVYRLASVAGRTVVTTLLLAGIAINALTGAATGLLTFVATDEQLRSITFWGLGSLGGATWQSVATVTPFIILPLIGIPYLARPLNALLLGEAEAGHLGVNVERVKQMIVLLVALAVGAAVSVAGIIGFVGLVTPHLLRLMAGPDHRTLLPGSALLGASLLLGADLIARTIVAPAELPLGIVTAILGAPFFLWLLLKDRKQSF